MLHVLFKLTVQINYLCLSALPQVAGVFHFQLITSKLPNGHGFLLSKCHVEESDTADSVGKSGFINVIYFVQIMKLLLDYKVPSHYVFLVL